MWIAELWIVNVDFPIQIALNRADNVITHGPKHGAREFRNSRIREREKRQNLKEKSLKCVHKQSKQNNQNLQFKTEKRCFRPKTILVLSDGDVVEDSSL